MLKPLADPQGEDQTKAGEAEEQPADALKQKTLIKTSQKIGECRFELVPHRGDYDEFARLEKERLEGDVTDYPEPFQHTCELAIKMTDSLQPPFKKEFVLVGNHRDKLPALVQMLGGGPHARVHYAATPPFALYPSKTGKLTRRDAFALQAIAEKRLFQILVEKQQVELPSNDQSVKDLLRLHNSIQVTLGKAIPPEQPMTDFQQVLLGLEQESPAMYEKFESDRENLRNLAAPEFSIWVPPANRGVGDFISLTRRHLGNEWLRCRTWEFTKFGESSVSDDETEITQPMHYRDLDGKSHKVEHSVQLSRGKLYSWKIDHVQQAEDPMEEARRLQQMAATFAAHQHTQGNSKLSLVQEGKLPDPFPTVNRLQDSLGPETRGGAELGNLLKELAPSVELDINGDKQKLYASEAVDRLIGIW
eukprot:4458141-Prymnesium_polylepis.1